MNMKIYQIGLLIIWIGVALFMFILGPIFAPEAMPEKSRAEMMGMGAIILALWNFVRLWSTRSANRPIPVSALYQKKMIDTKSDSKDKPIVCPDFAFEDLEKQVQPEKKTDSSQTTD